ncbi:hypothetical protein EVAR_33597_1 [Eumeta japonica]|uniref:Uncharacterized protein n=1 Tax=Eumeta variegata TaxID=151549 RepID=A0A4C1WA23_EUMVA|nr:hypothetical protein EVAR_33597_1 [Eumeta japonica]
MDTRKCKGVTGAWTISRKGVGYLMKRDREYKEEEEQRATGILTYWTKRNRGSCYFTSAFCDSVIFHAGNCGAMCGCQKAGMKCSAVCFHCSGETCSNVMELSELINENDFDDEPPTLTPLLQFSHWYFIQKPDQMLSRSLVHRND